MEEATARAKQAEEIQKAAQRAKAIEKHKKTAHHPFKPAVEQAYPSASDKALVQEYIPAPVVENHKEDYKREKAKEKATRAANTANKKPADYYNPETPADEVIKNRQIHQPHRHSFKFPKKKEKHPAADFNFKQALIYDAILRRPEY